MPQKATAPRVCLKCGADFLAQPRDVERGRAKYCSPQCCGSAGAAVTLARYPQQGENNFHYIDGRSKRPAFYAARDRRKHPRHWRARTLVHAAVASGKLVKPDTCQRCGETGVIQAHHPNYSKPLQVEWLCRPCHRQHHRAIGTARQ